MGKSKKRPDIWVGHVDLPTKDLAGSERFLKDVGLRFVFKNEAIVIYELRGGTHLIMFAKEEIEDTNASFDFMVEDVDATFTKFGDLGYEVSEMERGEIHDSFWVTEPGGNRIHVNSTHVKDHSIV